MNTYSDENSPKSGTGKVIYDAFKRRGWEVKYLRYNPNCFGNTSAGWGTWACEIWGTPYESELSLHDGVFFCGVKNGDIYLQNGGAPFNAWYI